MQRVVVVAALILNAFGHDVFAQQSATDAKPKTPSVRSLVFSPDGRTLSVVYGGTNSLTVWELSTLKPKFIIQDKAGVSAAAYSPAGDVLAIAVGKVTKLVDPESGEIRRELNGHESTVRSVAFSPDGKQLATASKDKTAKLWDLASGEVLRTFSDYQAPLIGVTISADGKWLATTCGTGDAVKLWDLASSDQAARKFEFSGAYLPQVAFSSDSKVLAIPDWGGRVTLIDVATGDVYLRFTSIGSTDCVAFSPDGKWMAFVTQDNQFTRFQLAWHRDLRSRLLPRPPRRYES